jgi:hypothetical protein
VHDNATVRGSVWLWEKMQEIDRATVLVHLYVSELWESAKKISLIHCLLCCRSQQNCINSRSIKYVRKLKTYIGTYETQ